MKEMDKIEGIKNVVHELKNLCSEITEDVEKLKEEVKMKEEIAEVMKARNALEERIKNEKGGIMNVEEKIKSYKIGNEIMLRLDDVLELCSVMKKKYRIGKEVGYMCDDENARIHAFLAINHVQTALLSCELSKVHTIDEHKKIIEEHTHNRKPLEITGRYAVGRQYDENYWMFFIESKDEKPVFSNRPCMAKLYMTYKQAEACRDFLDDGDWEVVDMWNFLDPDRRLERQLFGETEWDDGNENAVRLEC